MAIYIGRRKFIATLGGSAASLLWPLAARKVDVFLAVGNEPALRAALSVADGKPIAFLAIDFDPLAKGYVANLSHPAAM